MPSRIAANIHATEKHAMLPLQTRGAADAATVAIARCRIADTDTDATVAAATWLRWHVPIQLSLYGCVILFVNDIVNGIPMDKQILLWRERKRMKSRAII